MWDARLQPLIRLSAAAKSYASESGPIHALAPTDLSLETGRTLSVVGPSGSGKSTVLLLMAGLEAPTSGFALFKGQNLTKPHREIALVLQDYGLFPWKTIRRNVELGLRIRGESGIEARVRSLLDELEIGDKADVYPQQLSGGQRQRVALARALILNPSLLLLDEPFAALDTLTRERLQRLVADLWRDRKFGMITVTHNIEEAVRLGQRIAVMKANPGAVVDFVDNPRACSEDYNGEEEFFETCREVRRRLELVT